MQSDVGVMLHRPCCAQAFVDVGVAGVAARFVWHRGYGATVARLTPDQKVGSSNLSALIFQMPMYLIRSMGTCLPCLQAPLVRAPKGRGIFFQQSTTEVRTGARI